MRDIQNSFGELRVEPSMFVVMEKIFVLFISRFVRTSGMLFSPSKIMFSNTKDRTSAIKDWVSGLAAGVIPMCDLYVVRYAGRSMYGLRFPVLANVCSLCSNSSIINIIIQIIS